MLRKFVKINTNSMILSFLTSSRKGNSLNKEKLPLHQPSFTFPNPSFHRATDHSDILLQINQSKYVSVFVVSFSSIYVFATSYASATDYAFVYAFANASANALVYTFVYAFIYAFVYAFATGYEFTTDYASKSTSAPTLTETPRSEMTVPD